MYYIPKKIGEELELTMPFGEYTLQDKDALNVLRHTENENHYTNSKNETKNNHHNDIVFISAGVGITPIYALVTSVYHQHQKQDKNNNNNNNNNNDNNVNGKKRNVTFIHGAHDGNSLFIDAVNTVKKYAGITTKIFLSHPSETDTQNNLYDEKGRISLDAVSSYINSNASYYVCGPTSFMTSIHKQLVDVGVNNNNIHMELFSTGSIPL